MAGRIGRRVFVGWVVTVALFLTLAGPALAGGWAVVTLDSLPRDPRAGETLTLGFMVRQHGVTPIDGAYGGGTMAPILTARNAQTGQTVRVEGRKADATVGHFVVEVAFPATGAWTWEIAPPPFEATQLGTLTVLPAAAPAPGALIGGIGPRPILRWLGALLLLVAVMLGLWGQRAALLRRRVAPAAPGD